MFIHINSSSLHNYFACDTIIPILQKGKLRHRLGHLSKGIQRVCGTAWNEPRHLAPGSASNTHGSRGQEALARFLTWDSKSPPSSARSGSSPLREAPAGERMGWETHFPISPLLTKVPLAISSRQDWVLRAQTSPLFIVLGDSPLGRTAR